MFESIDTTTPEFDGATPGDKPWGTAVSRPAPGAERQLARGDILFQAGDTRSTAYRVVSGALCHYVRWPCGRHDVIEFAFAGDIIGLGHLDSHVSTAQSMVEATVVQVPPDELERAIDADAQLATRLAAAADREFDYLRARSLAVQPRTPTKRLAALLAALAHIRAREGADPAIIEDTASPGWLSQRLGMSIAALQQALQELQRQGFLTTDGADVRLGDADALEKFANSA